jgi:hypothetical protein
MNQGMDRHKKIDDSTPKRENSPFQHHSPQTVEVKKNIYMFERTQNSQQISTFTKPKIICN